MKVRMMMYNIGIDFITHKIETRPTKDQYYLGIADAVAKRSTCIIRNYGAVIVHNDEIISTGYNGSPRGLPNCIDNLYCNRSAVNSGIIKGKNYDSCVSVHAEMNAMLSARRSDMVGAVLYLTCFDQQECKLVEAIPCSMCLKMLQNAGIERIVTWAL